MKRVLGALVLVASVTAIGPPSATASHGNEFLLTSELWIMDADGSNESVLVDEWASGTSDLEWAPDNSLIAARRFDTDPATPQQSELLVVDPDTGEVRIVTEPEEEVGSFAWAPDSSRLLYEFEEEGENGFRTVAPDGSDRQTVYSPPPNTSLTGVDYSPDGASIAFLKSPPRSSTYLHILDLSTGIDRVVTSEVSGYSTVDWSPDGDWIVFEVAFENGDLYIVRPDGSDGKLAARGAAVFGDIRWAPDSTELLAEVSDDSDEGIFRVSAETGDHELIVAGAENPTWAPDALRFAYSAIVAPAEDTDIFSASRDGSGVTRLTSEDRHNDFRPSWSPDGSRIAFVRAGVVISCPQFNIGPAGPGYSKPATIIGTTGNDQIEGTPERDVIAGRGGDDEIIGLGGDDLICGGKGSDEIAGGDGRDKLRGDTGDDVLRGDADDDVLDGGADDDMLDGGAGRDAISHSTGREERDVGVTVDLAAGVAQGFGADVVTGIEDAYGSNDADVILGDSGRNRLFGGSHVGGDWDDDVLKGFAGRDRLEGWSDSDRLYGGRGADRLDGQNGDRTRGGVDRLAGGPGRDTCIRGDHYVSCEVQRT